MTKKFIPVALLATCLVMVGLLTFAPSFAFAQTNGGNTSNSGETPTLPNPLGKNVNLIDVMLRVMQIALATVDIFALFMFILGGFEFLVSAGNPTMIKKAKDTLIWATLGILVITLSYSILKFVFEEVQKGFGS